MVSRGDQVLPVGGQLEALASSGEAKVLQQLEASAVRVVLAQGAALGLGQPRGEGLAACDVVDLLSCWVAVGWVGGGGERGLGEGVGPGRRGRRGRDEREAAAVQSNPTLTPSGADTFMPPPPDILAVDTGGRVDRAGGSRMTGGGRGAGGGCAQQSRRGTLSRLARARLGESAERRRQDAYV